MLALAWHAGRQFVTGVIAEHLDGMAQRWDDKAKTLLVYRVEHIRAWIDK